MAIRREIEDICIKHHGITHKNLLEILTFVSENHPNLLFLVFYKNLDKWESMVKSKSRLSTIEIDRMVTFPSILLANRNNFDLPELKNMSNVLLGRVSLSMRDRRLSMEIVNKILPILASSMNRLAYDEHVKALGRCIQGKRLDELKLGVFTTEYFVDYLNYLICLFRVRCDRNAYAKKPK